MEYFYSRQKKVKNWKIAAIRNILPCGKLKNPDTVIYLIINTIPDSDIT